MALLPNNLDAQFAKIMSDGGINEKDFENKFKVFGFRKIIKSWCDMVDATVDMSNTMKQLKKQLFGTEDIMTGLINKSIEPVSAVKQFTKLVGMGPDIPRDMLDCSLSVNDAMDIISHAQFEIMSALDDFNDALLCQTYECMTYARLMRMQIVSLPGDHSKELEQINQKCKLLQL